MQPFEGAKQRTNGMQSFMPQLVCGKAGAPALAGAFLCADVAA